jgi:hypothetical protein
MKSVNKFLFAILTSISCCAYAQGPTLEQLRADFTAYRRDHLQEKIYLHTDRDFVITGESLWLKAYYVDGTFHKPLDLSKILYVEILDRNNRSVVQTKLRLVNGSGSGSIFIPASLNTGNYTLRAYTRWMKNFSPDYFFHKNISLVNPFVKPEALAATNTRPARTVVDFFPEGGSLVRGLKSKVAVRVYNSEGKPLQVTGSLISGSDTLARVQTSQAGIGHFYFTPTSDSSGTSFALGRNSSERFRLPAAKSSGYVINVNDSTEKFLRVNAWSLLNANTSNSMSLFVHSRGAVTQTFAAAGNRAVFNIDKSMLREGISHITLFNDKMEPVCERLYFKKPSNVLSVKINTDQQQYGVRRKVKLDIEATINDKGVPADFSLAVWRDDSLTAGNTMNIVSYLLLSSDLPALDHNFTQYLQPGSLEVDDLLLTFGWRRFIWKDVLQKKEEQLIAPEYRGHFITGKISQPDGSPAAGIMTYMASPDKVVRIYPAVSDAKGQLKFEAKQFPGSRRLIVQNAYDSLFRIEIDNPFSNRFASTFRAGRFSIDRKMESKLVERTIGMQVQDIYVENSRERFTMKDIDSLGFYGRSDETYVLDDYTRFPVMEEVMREYVPGVLVRKRRDGFHFIVIDKVHRTTMREDPLILLDGVPVTDTDDIMSFDPRKVRKLEVVTKPWYLGPAVFPGIVSYTTYNGDLAGFEFPSHTLQMDYEGLQIEREFYLPVYENQSQRNDRTPDMRSTVYWNPQVKTDATGKAHVEFFTSDLQGNFMISTEGLSPEGVPGTGVQNFVVKSFEN